MSTAADSLTGAPVEQDPAMLALRKRWIPPHDGITAINDEIAQIESETSMGGGKVAQDQADRVAELRQQLQGHRAALETLLGETEALSVQTEECKEG